MSNINSYDDIEWACTGGGPLVAVEERDLMAWCGSDVPTDGRVIETDYRFDDDMARPACDYDRACAVKRRYSQLISVGQGSGLVLGDSPDQTMWWPLPNGGIMVKWSYAEEEDDLIRFMRIVPELPPVEDAEIWHLPDGRIHLFDSAYDGLSVINKACPDAISFNISPGTYSVKNCVYEPNPETQFILHWLERVG